MFKNNASRGLWSSQKKAKDSDFYENLNTAVALGKTRVPLKHKQLAASYMLIKKIFGSCATPIPITTNDKGVLHRHGFQQLELTTIAQANKQIEQLKSWSNSGDILLDAYANELFEIRIKELKFIRLTMSDIRKVEFKQGYKAYEKYVEYISR